MAPRTTLSPGARPLKADDAMGQHRPTYDYVHLIKTHIGAQASYVRIRKLVTASNSRVANEQRATGTSEARGCRGRMMKRRNSQPPPVAAQGQTCYSAAGSGSLNVDDLALLKQSLYCSSVLRGWNEAWLLLQKYQVGFALKSPRMHSPSASTFSCMCS